MMMMSEEKQEEGWTPCETNPQDENKKKVKKLGEQMPHKAMGKSKWVKEETDSYDA
jgi:hypothetical protein